jgi:hypothetical protein
MLSLLKKSWNTQIYDSKLPISATVNMENTNLKIYMHNVCQDTNHVCLCMVEAMGTLVFIFNTAQTKGSINTCQTHIEVRCKRKEN